MMQDIGPAYASSNHDKNSSSWDSETQEDQNIIIISEIQKIKKMVKRIAKSDKYVSSPKTESFHSENS